MKYLARTTDPKATAWVKGVKVPLFLNLFLRGKCRKMISPNWFSKQAGAQYEKQQLQAVRWWQRRLGWVVHAREGCKIQLQHECGSREKCVADTHAVVVMRLEDSECRTVLHRLIQCIIVGVQHRAISWVQLVNPTET